MITTKTKTDEVRQLLADWNTRLVKLIDADLDARSHVVELQAKLAAAEEAARVADQTHTLAVTEATEALLAHVVPHAVNCVTGLNNAANTLRTRLAVDGPNAERSAMLKRIEAQILESLDDPTPVDHAGLNAEMATH